MVRAAATRPAQAGSGAPNRVAGEREVLRPKRRDVAQYFRPRAGVPAPQHNAFVCAFPPAAHVRVATRFLGHGDGWCREQPARYSPNSKSLSLPLSSVRVPAVRFGRLTCGETARAAVRGPRPELTAGSRSARRSSLHPAGPAQSETRSRPMNKLIVNPIPHRSETP